MHIWKKIFFLTCLFLLMLVFLPKTGFELDLFCWKEWTKYIFLNGLPNAYKSGTDYMPVMQYLMFLFGKIQGSVPSIEHNINYIKIIPLVFDFLAGILILKIISHKKSDSDVALLSSFYFLNIAVFYNTLFWGQVDSILSTLVFISVYSAHQQKTNIALLTLLLALNFKLQAIIFIPLVGLLLLPAIVQPFNLKSFLITLFIIGITQFILIAPFIYNGDFNLLIRVINESFHKYPVVSLNSGGIWNLLMKGELSHISDAREFLRMSLKTWGLIMFFSVSFFSLLPLIKLTLNNIRTKNKNNYPLDKVLITGTLIPVLFCYLNTEMHERYIHPAIVFIVTYSILYRSYLIMILLCLGYTLNLEHAIQVLNLKTYGTLPFSRIFLAIIYLISIILLFIKLYEVKYSLRRLAKTPIN